MYHLKSLKTLSHDFVIVVVLIVLLTYLLITYAPYKIHNHGSLKQVRDKIRSFDEYGQHRIYTAISSNHYNNFMEVLQPSTVQNFPGAVLIVYDIGLTPRQGRKLRSRSAALQSAIVYRRFDFTKYPQHIRHLNQYQFKPMIVKDAMHELGHHSGMFWADSSVQWKNNTLNRLKQLTTLINSNISVSPMWLLTTSETDVLPYTHPAMFAELNVKPAELAHKTMGQVTLIYSHNTPKSHQIVNEWVDCGLRKHCMSPIGAQLFCKTPNRRGIKFGGCHRFDQSAINLIIAKEFGFDTRKYIDFSNFANVRR